MAILGRNKGFTLLELIIVIGIFVLLVVFFAPAGINFYKKEILNNTANELSAILKEARDNAVNQKNNAAFGVQILPQQFLLFQGDNYENRDQASIIIYQYPAVISVSGLPTIIFAPNTGFTQAGSIFLSNGLLTKEIKVNEVGVIN